MSQKYFLNYYVKIHLAEICTVMTERLLEYKCYCWFCVLYCVADTQPTWEGAVRGVSSAAPVNCSSVSLTFWSLQRPVPTFQLWSLPSLESQHLEGMRSLCAMCSSVIRSRNKHMDLPMNHGNPVNLLRWVMINAWFLGVDCVLSKVVLVGILASTDWFQQFFHFCIRRWDTAVLE